MEQLQKFAIFSGGFVLSFAHAQLLRKKQKGLLLSLFCFFKCLMGALLPLWAGATMPICLPALQVTFRCYFRKPNRIAFANVRPLGNAYAIFPGRAAVVACSFRSSTLPDLAEVVAQQHRSWHTKYFRRGNRCQCK